MTTEKIQNQMEEQAVACHNYYTGVPATNDQREKLKKAIQEIFHGVCQGENHKSYAEMYQKRIDSEND